MVSYLVLVARLEILQLSPGSTAAAGGLARHTVTAAEAAAAVAALAMLLTKQGLVSLLKAPPAADQS